MRISASTTANRMPAIQLTMRMVRQALGTGRVEQHGIRSIGHIRHLLTASLLDRYVVSMPTGDDQDHVAEREDQEDLDDHVGAEFDHLAHQRGCFGGHGCGGGHGGVLEQCDQRVAERRHGASEGLRQDNLSSGLHEAQAQRSCGLGLANRHGVDARNAAIRTRTPPCTGSGR